MESIVIRGPDGKVDLANMLALLAEREINEVHVEAGLDRAQLVLRARVRGQCERFANKDHSLSVDKYGRVHTQFTSLPSRLRFGRHAESMRASRSHHSQTHVMALAADTQELKIEPQGTEIGNALCSLACAS